MQLVVQGAIEKSKGAQPAVQSWWASFLQDFANSKR